MKKYFISALLVAFAFCVSAGDAAIFVDNGFSADGSVYIFSQYGQTDKTYRGWAEIYTVDVAENKYISENVYITSPSANTAKKAGKDIYASLMSANFSALDKYRTSSATVEQILYINGDESRRPTDEIVFKDFGIAPVESQATYHVRLVPTVSGSGKNVTSSFYIMLEKYDADGRILGRQKIGSPDISRKGVAAYKIQKIFCDKSGKNIIFVVEKNVNDDTGVSVRYMVEAATLDVSLRVSVAPKM